MWYLMEGSKTLFFSSKFPLGMQENFFEIYRQFGHVPSNSIASSALDFWTWNNKVLWVFKNIKTTSPMTQHHIPEGQILHQWTMFTNILTFISDCL
jgi:hypothetical protein